MLQFLGKVDLKEGGLDKLVRVQLLREGEWSHPKAPGGKLRIDRKTLETFHRNFKDGIVGEVVPMNEAHEDKTFRRAKGWVKDMELTDEGLVGYVEPTPDIMKAVENKEVRFVSCELDMNFRDPESGKQTQVIRGVAWTNVPYIKRMKPAEVVNLAEFDDDPDAGEDYEGASQEEGSSLADAKDPDAVNLDLPEQCRSCALLFSGECPFAGIEIKTAAAGTGDCPQYQSTDSSTTAQGDEEDEHNDNGGRMSEQITALQEENARLKARLHLGETQGFVSKLVEEGRLTPAQERDAVVLLSRAHGMEGTINLSETETVELGDTPFPDLVKNFLQGLQQVDLAEKGDRKPVAKGADDTDAAIAFANQYAKDGKGTFRDGISAYKEAMNGTR